MATAHIFIQTGEVSGDLQGALLIESLQRQAIARGYDLTISAMGGHQMAAAGAKLLGNTVSVSSIGIVEALPYVRRTLQLQKQAQDHIRANPPDLVVLLDYIRPNILLGNFLRQRFPKIPIAYYIAPQQWVWEVDPKDTPRILKVSDKLIAIFPEEARYYRQQLAPKERDRVVFVGHPLIERYPKKDYRSAARARLGLSATETVVTLLPASRAQELKYLVPSVVQAAELIRARLGEVTFLLALSRPDFEPQIKAILAEATVPVRLVCDDPHKDAIAAADLAIAKSGTANLEIALMDVPQLVVYRLSRLTAWLIQYIVGFNAPYLSPVNLVELEPIVPELVQAEATPAAIAREAIALLTDSDRRAAMQAGYQRMRAALGEAGACDRAAREILDMLPQPIGLI